jgi:hypothetical protein
LTSKQITKPQESKLNKIQKEVFTAIVAAQSKVEERKIQEAVSLGTLKGSKLEEADLAPCVPPLCVVERECVFTQLPKDYPVQEDPDSTIITPASKNYPFRTQLQAFEDN